MVQSFFTSVSQSADNGTFTATVYNKNTNEKIYTTPAYNNQQKALSDAESFVLTGSAPARNILSHGPSSSVTRVDPGQVQPMKKCCGRK